MVIDTSALLALFFGEPHGRWVLERIRENLGDLHMSTVNLAETLILVEDRNPAALETIERRLLSGIIRMVPPDAEHARQAARARNRFPINLGDCFAYALAAQRSSPLLTLDRGFRKTDLELILPG